MKSIKILAMVASLMFPGVAPGQEPDVNVTLDVAAFMLADAPRK